MQIRNIIDKIDSDKDDSVTADELKEWIKSVKNRLFFSDVDSKWEVFKDHNSLEDFLDMSYGALTHCKY